MRAIARRDDVLVRMQLVRSCQRTRTRHGDGMSPARAAFGRDEVIPAIALVEMRRLGEPDGRALEDVLPLAHQLALRDGILLQYDAAEAVAPGAVIPELVHEVLAAVVVVEQRRIEAAAVE